MTSLEDIEYKKFSTGCLNVPDAKRKTSTELFFFKSCDAYAMFAFPENTPTISTEEKTACC